MMKTLGRRIRHLRPHKPDYESGAAAVELALISFPLSVMMIGIINFGYALFALNQIQAISNETIRAVSYGGVTQGDAINLTTSKLQRFGGPHLTISIDDSDPLFRELTVSGSSEHLTLVDFPFASLEYYNPNFSVSTNAPKFKTTSVAAGT